jgi:two-component system nitrogen regulation response regulator NtrX
MIMVADEVVQPRHLDLPPVSSNARRNRAALPLREAREQFEREYVSQVVEACAGNMTRAARTLGLERSHLYRKLRALGLRSR